jgi:F-type H+-transporting ATPase subunit b
MFLKIDGTLWIQLVNFAIFFAILNAVFLRPVGEAIRKRRVYIDAVHADYESAGAAAKAARTEAERKRGAARRQGDETIAKARAEGETAAATIVGERTTEAQSIIELARATVATEAAAASAKTPALAEALATSLVDCALGAPR